jgi:N-acetylmuramoyl-L-alanine amidase
LSNESDESLLNEEQYQEKVAWAIYMGILNYFSEIQNLED